MALKSRAWLVATILIATAIFVMDLATPIEVSVAIFYIVVILMAMKFLPPRKVILVAIGCIGLTLGGTILDLFTMTTNSSEIGVANRIFSIVGIGAAAYLAAALRRSEALRTLALDATEIGAWEYDPRKDKVAMEFAPARS